MKKTGRSTHFHGSGPAKWLTPSIRVSHIILYYPLNNSLGERFAVQPVIVLDGFRFDQPHELLLVHHDHSLFDVRVLPQYRLSAFCLVRFHLALHGPLGRGPAALLACTVHTATDRPAARRRVYQHNCTRRLCVEEPAGFWVVCGGWIFRNFDRKKKTNKWASRKPGVLETLDCLQGKKNNENKQKYIVYSTFLYGKKIDYIIGDNHTTDAYIYIAK